MNELIPHWSESDHRNKITKKDLKELKVTISISELSFLVV